MSYADQRNRENTAKEDAKQKIIDASIRWKRVTEALLGPHLNFEELDDGEKHLFRMVEHYQQVFK